MLTDEERARREPWGRVEEAVNDAMNGLYEARDGLPDGEAKDEISDWLLTVNNNLGEVAQVAIDVCHGPM